MITEDTELDITALGLKVGQYVQAIAVGGGGGGGGGAGGVYLPDHLQFNCNQINKTVMDFLFNDDPANNFFNLAAMQGEDGTAGGDTKIDNYITAKGGQAGKGGTFSGINCNKNTTNATYYNLAYYYAADQSNSPGGAGGAGWQEEQGFLGAGGNGGQGTKASNWYNTQAYAGVPLIGGGGGGGGAAGQVIIKTIKIDKPILNITIGKGGKGGAGGIIYNGYYNFGMGANIQRIQYNYNYYMENKANGVDMTNFTYQAFNNGKPYGFTNMAKYSGNGGNAGYGGYRGNTNMTSGSMSGCAGDGGFGFGAGGGGGGGFGSVMTGLPANNTTGVNFSGGGGGGGGGCGYQIGELRRGVVKATSGTMGIYGYEIWNTTNRWGSTNNGGGGVGGYSTEFSHITGTSTGKTGYNLFNYNTQSYASSGQGKNGSVSLNNACLGNGVVILMW